ncbi:MAG: PadR family transcriptional regulator, partial [Nocardioidaceae bacterium]
MGPRSHDEGSEREEHWRQHHGPGPFAGPFKGPPPWVAQMFGAGANWGHHQRGHGGRGRGPRARRGDVRAAILDVLGHEQMNGYQVIQRITERTNGAWKPSPGSVY